MREPNTGATGGEPASGADRPGAEGEAFYTVSDRTQNVRNMTVVFGVLFVVGLVAVWVMSRTCGPKTAKAAASKSDEAQLEAAIGRLTGARSLVLDRMDHIVSKFYEFSDVAQVSVDQLVKNPFECQIFAGVPSAPGPTPDSSEAQARDAERLLREQLAKKAAALDLLSIMRQGAHAQCIIDDTLLKEGDRVRGFRVVRIADDQVELVWEPATPEAVEGLTSEFRTVLKLSE